MPSKYAESNHAFFVVTPLKFSLCVLGGRLRAAGIEPLTWFGFIKKE